MSLTKRIVCLANSRKLQGRCIAGRELMGERTAGWIRPVSDREHEEVSEYERQYEDGSDPRVMDVIDIPMREPRPRGYQQENWLIEPQEYWVKIGQLSWADLRSLADPSGTLWRDGHHTSNGVNDCIPLDKVAEVGSSLKLVYVEEMQLSVFKPGEAFGNPKRRVQARFRLGGRRYALWVTDPLIERAYLALEDGDYGLGESYLTISLGEPYKGQCRKLVAAVIQARETEEHA